MLRTFFLSLLTSSFLFAAEAPVGGHGTMRLGLDAGAHETLGAGLGLSYRYGLHDFLDRQSGYPEYTQLDILSFRLEAFPRGNQFFVDEITLFRFVRLPPLTAKWEELSWKVEVGGRSLREASCLRCAAGNLLAGLGATVQPIEALPVSLWFLVEGELLVSPSFTGFPIKPSFGPRVGLRFLFAPWLNGMLYGAYRYQLDTAATQIIQAGTEWRVSFAPNWALNLRVQRLSDGWQGLGGLYTYF